MLFHMLTISVRQKLIALRKFEKCKRFFSKVQKRSGITLRRGDNVSEFHWYIWIYDSRIKADIKAKIRPSSILIYNSSKTKKAKEMIVTPKENILIYFHLRQKNFVLCTHKAHFCRLNVFFRFLLKIAYFHQQNRGVSKIVCASTWHKKNILKYTSWVYVKIFYIINIVTLREYRKF